VNLFCAVNVIYSRSLILKQIFSGIGLSAGNSNILPRSIFTNQILPLDIIKSNALVTPLSILTKQDSIINTVKGVTTSI